MGFRVRPFSSFLHTQSTSPFSFPLSPPRPQHTPSSGDDQAQKRYVGRVESQVSPFSFLFWSAFVFTFPLTPSATAAGYAKIAPGQRQTLQVSLSLLSPFTYASHS